MSKMGNFVLAMEEFTSTAAGMSTLDVAGLATIYFPDDMERAYAMQQYNPSRYSSMTQAKILRDLSIAGME